MTFQFCLIGVNGSNPSQKPAVLQYDERRMGGYTYHKSEPCSRNAEFAWSFCARTTSATMASDRFQPAPFVEFSCATEVQRRSRPGPGGNSSPNWQSSPAGMCKIMVSVGKNTRARVRMSRARGMPPPGLRPVAQARETHAPAWPTKDCTGCRRPRPPVPNGR